MSDLKINVDLKQGFKEKIEKDYNNLENKPKINNVELTGDVSLEALGLSQEDKDSMPIRYLSPDTTPEDILNLEEGLYYLPDRLYMHIDSVEYGDNDTSLEGLFIYYPESSETFYNTHSDTAILPAIDTQHECICGLYIDSADVEDTRAMTPSLRAVASWFIYDNLFNYIEAIYNKVSLLRFKIMSETDYTFELEDTFSDICSAVENKLASINGYDEKYGAIASLYNGGDIYYMSYFKNDPDIKRIVFSGTGDGNEYRVYTMYPGRNTLDTFDLSKLTNQTDATPAYIDIQSESDDTFTLSEDVGAEYLEDAMYYEYDNITTYGLVFDSKPCRQVFLTGTDELGRKTYYALTGTEYDENYCLNMRFSGIDPNGNYKVYSIAESAEDGSLINTVKSYSLTEVQ